MLERFRRHVADANLLPEGAKLLVGYSGGADSTCLLHMLAAMKVDVVAAHLHHGQREEADDELRRCSEFADALGVPFVSGRADVPRIAEDMGVGLEEAGREARYSFFRQAAHRLECEWIVTAHTRTDLVETMLLNIARGTGLAGLAGIPERREEIVRPLLPFSRDETRAYCEANGLWFHDDPTNADISFSRARIRHRVLPELRSVNKAVEASLVRLASLANEEDRFLNGMAAAALEQCEVRLNGDLDFLTRDVEIRFDRGRFSSLPVVLVKRSVRLATEALGGSLSYDQTERIRLGLAGSEKGSVTADGGEVVIEWDSQFLDVRLLRPTSPFRFPLTVPGETDSDEFGWQFRAYEAVFDGTPPQRNAMRVQLPRRQMSGMLFFRTAQSGDNLRPLGFEGHRKISDLLSEAHLTEAARRRIPIVCDFIGPVWIPGVCLDERGRATDGDSVTVIEFGALPGTVSGQ